MPSVSAKTGPLDGVREIRCENDAERFILSLVRRGALFAVSHSGGKDSQAMLLHMLALGIPREQMILVHAHLADVMWPDAMEHIRSVSHGIEIIEAHPVTPFLQMVDRRGRFPTPDIRQCTSDLKRGPIEREVRHWLYARPDHSRIVVSCMGLRAQESRDRGQKSPLKWSARNSKAGRQWFEWLPILSLTSEDVFQRIKEAGEQPHPRYAMGFSRYSCPFCIFGSDEDHRRAAQLVPDIYAAVCEREVRHDFTLSPSRRTLPERTGITPQCSSTHRHVLIDRLKL